MNIIQLFREPWDGPASVSFTDGHYIGAVLDRMACVLADITSLMTIVSSWRVKWGGTGRP